MALVQPVERLVRSWGGGRVNAELRALKIMVSPQKKVITLYLYLCSHAV